MALHRPFLSIAFVVCANWPLIGLADEDHMARAQSFQEEGRYGLALNAYLQAAEQGHVQAQRTAGLMLLHGERVYGQEIRQDKAKGIWLLNKAAANGCEISKQLLQRVDTPNKG